MHAKSLPTVSRFDTDAPSMPDNGFSEGLRRGCSQSKHDCPRLISRRLGFGRHSAGVNRRDRPNCQDEEGLTMHQMCRRKIQRWGRSPSDPSVRSRRRHRIGEARLSHPWRTFWLPSPLDNDSCNQVRACSTEREASWTPLTVRFTMSLSTLGT